VRLPPFLICAPFLLTACMDHHPAAVAVPDSVLDPATLDDVSASATARPIVNAPVAPEAIYVGRRGNGAGLSVIDLNGFGQGTGEPALSRFPLNPNIGLPGVQPPLAPGVSTLDAGSAGVLTLTVDSQGSDLLLQAPRLRDVTALAVGQPLDLAFNNENTNPNTIGSNHVNPRSGATQDGNCIESAPHPNPPRIVVPSPNPGHGIDAEEPSTTTSAPVPGEVTTTSPPCFPSPLNVLVPGNPFSNRQGELGLFGSNHPGVFVGPQPPPLMPAPPVPFCPYTIRQQLGHFLYVLDPAAHRVLVLNSNRCTVLAQIALPDPVAMAFAPDLRRLAVSNHAQDTVSFIDTDPRSRTFHQVVATVGVGNGPRALAWQPEGEALLVCNERGHSVSILDGASLQVRRTLHRLLHAPQAIAVTPRQDQLGLGTGSYYAFVQNQLGLIVVYESAASNGGGADDVVLTLPLVILPGAAGLRLDMASLSPAFWIGHHDPNGLGQVSRFELVQGRHWLSLQRTVAIGGLDSTTPVRDLLSGNQIVDLAFDDIRNQGALADRRSSPLPPGALQHSHKGVVKLGGSGFVPAHAPRLLFVALADVNKVDVIEVDTGRREHTIDTPGVSCLANYFRQ